jgi:hypothetical protein
VGGTRALNKLKTDAGGTTRINTTAITTTLDQNYDDAVTLGADAVLNGDNIVFASTVDGAKALTVNSSGSGATTFAAAVGATTPLTSLTTNGDGTTNLNGGSVSTSAAQSYGDDVVLGADTIIGGTDVTFAKTLNSDGTNRDLTVNGSGITMFSGLVGNTSALKNVTTDAPGSTQINGKGVATTADQDYKDAVRNWVITPSSAA